MLKSVTASCSAALLIASSAAFAGSSELPYQGEGHLLLDPAELEWSDVASMAPPAEIAVIEGDLGAEEPFTFRLNLPAGYEIDPHIHPAYERVTVISGSLHFAHGDTFDRERAQELPQGGVAIMAPGEPMFGYTEVDTVIQLHGTGPWGIDYINDEDDPRT
ncbi:cupin domain-containing protein [Fodinicurvata sp. EGI_FJ10296]|uniref:cupin domain-containing protein n=1 Tax=Fodinicurvata sp. EGI_FJ10296 TaxID=3231908 RepID=UPI00345361C6